MSGQSSKMTLEQSRAAQNSVQVAGSHSMTHGGKGGQMHGNQGMKHGMGGGKKKKMSESMSKDC